MRWKITKDFDGCNRLRLEKHTGLRWKTVEQRYWHSSKDLSEVVPAAKVLLWTQFIDNEAVRIRNREVREANRGYAKQE